MSAFMRSVGGNALTPEEEAEQRVEFVKTTIRGWIASIMQDFDAQGIDIGLREIWMALYELEEELGKDVNADGDTILEWLDNEEPTE